MKKISLFLIIIIILTTLCACGPTIPTMQNADDVENTNSDEYSMFIAIETNDYIGYLIVYHRDTKVMYAISRGVRNCGTFTVMLNPDGTPMLYTEGRDGNRN